MALVEVADLPLVVDVHLPGIGVHPLDHPDRDLRKGVAYVVLAAEEREGEPSDDLGPGRPAAVGLEQQLSSRSRPLYAAAEWRGKHGEAGLLARGSCSRTAGPA